MHHRILVINPNSSAQMTGDIEHTLQQMLEGRSDFAVDVVRMPGSPNVLESFRDYMAAGNEVCRYLAQNDIRGMYDAVVLACFGDPQLQAVKESCPVPVVGIAESAMSMALLQGWRFSILAASEKARPMMEFLVQSYGLRERCASVETFGVCIEEMMEDHDRMVSFIINKARDAVRSGAETVILGCAGMTSAAREAEAALGIPILDPNVAGVSMAIAMILGEVGISRAGLYR